MNTASRTRHAAGATRRRRRARCRRALVAVAVALAMALPGLSGCERVVRNMYHQPKDPPLATSELFADGQSSRPLVEASVASAGGDLAGASSGRAGALPLPVHAGPVLPVLAPSTTTSNTAPGTTALGGAPRNPLAPTRDVLLRGQQRFDIYCAPCHSAAGDGDGMVARRGFPHPPTFHSDRLRNAPDGHFFQVITRGYGAMYPYADRVASDDRWAIVHYIRALQLSQHATLAAVPNAEAGKRAAILEAEGLKESQVRKAEGEKDISALSALPNASSSSERLSSNAAF